MARLNSTDNIIRRADALVRSTGTRDPERIAEALGIIVMDVNFEKQKGLYKVILRNRFIFIKSDLSEVMRRIVLLHEIGHDQLHRHLDVVFQKFQIFDMSRNVMEYRTCLQHRSPCRTRKSSNTSAAAMTRRRSRWRWRRTSISSR